MRNFEQNGSDQAVVDYDKVFETICAEEGVKLTPADREKLIDRMWQQARDDFWQHEDTIRQMQTWRERWLIRRSVKRSASSFERIFGFERRRAQRACNRAVLRNLYAERETYRLLLKQHQAASMKIVA